MESTATDIRASRDLTTVESLGGCGSGRGVSISEIHRYPLKPEGLEEPLWMTREWRRVILDHLCESSWLCRASEIPVRTSTQSAHSVSKFVYILKRERGSFVVDRSLSGRSGGGNSCGVWRKRMIVEVVDLWREVRGWWLPESINRLIARVILAGGAVVDLARCGSSGEDGWKLVGVVD